MTYGGKPASNIDQNQCKNLLTLNTSRVRVGIFSGESRFILLSSHNFSICLSVSVGLCLCWFLSHFFSVSLSLFPISLSVPPSFFCISSFLSLLPSPSISLCIPIYISPPPPLSLSLSLSLSLAVYLTQTLNTKQDKTNLKQKRSQKWKLWMLLPCVSDI